jgi:hypothetical protein
MNPIEEVVSLMERSSGKAPGGYSLDAAASKRMP